MTLNIGDKIGAYRIDDQLGQGGMATVFKAYHAALDRYVAIKVLHAAFTADSSFLARFQREARVVAKLEHPNIVPVYDYAEFDGAPYLVMKFIEGETLTARLARGPLPLAETKRVIAAVGAALDYAHRQGILHRDIKPSNIMLAQDGSLYLADFGLARIAQAGESTLSADSMLGTPAYMSPEQAKGIKDLDARADIYSFGVVAYELVVGRVPFSGDTAFSVVHDHIFTPPPAPRFVNPRVPEAVERVLLQALAKDRADRYADVRAFVTAFLDAVAASAETVAAPTAEATRVSPGDDASLLASPDRAVVGPLVPTAATPQPAPAVRSSRLPVWVWVGLGVVALMMLVALVGLGLVSLRNQTSNALATQARRTSIAVAAVTADARTRRAATLTAAAQAQTPAVALVSATAAANLRPTATPASTQTAPPPTTPTATPFAAAALLARAAQAFDNQNSSQGFALLDQAVQTDPTSTALLLRAGDIALAHGSQYAQPALASYYLPANALEARRKDSSAGQLAAHIALAMYALAAVPDGGAYLAGLVPTFSPPAEPQLFLDLWRISSQTDLSSAESDLTQAGGGSLALRLVRGDLLLSQRDPKGAAAAYTAIADTWTTTTPLWILKEAQCEGKDIRQNRASAALKVTCEPISTLVTGP